MPTIMTLGRQLKRFRLRGRIETLIPDFREIRFPCSFMDGAVNGAPKLRVSVGEVGHGKPGQIRIEIVPPESGPPGSAGSLVSEVLIATAGQPATLSGPGLAVVPESPDGAGGASAFVSAPPSTAGGFAARELPRSLPRQRARALVSRGASGPGELAGLASGSGAPGVSARLDDGLGPRTGFDGVAGDLVFEDPFPPFDPDPFPPIDPEPPGGGGGPVREIVERDLVPGADPGGQWRVRLHNLADEAREFLIEVEYPESVQNLVTTRVPYHLVNRTFHEVLLLMGPRLTVNNGHARLRFTDEFKTLTGLRDIDSSVDGRLTRINLESLSLRLGRQLQFNNPAILVGLELEERGDEIDVFGPDGNIDNMSMAIELIMLLTAPPLTDFFRTAMVRDNGTVRPRAVTVLAEISTHPQLRGFWINALDFLKDSLRGDSFNEVVRDMVEKAERGLNTAMRDGGAALLQDVLTQLVERDHVLHSLSAGASDLIVQHHAKPDPFNRPILPGEGQLAGSQAAGSTPSAEPAAGAGATRPDFAAVAAANPAIALANATLATAGASAGDGSEARARFAPFFIRRRSFAADGPGIGAVRSAGVPLVREGQIDHIVVLMMENRSFDHMLGYRALKGHPVNGLIGNEENAIGDGNRPYRVRRLTKTAGIPGPGHSFKDAGEQMAGGAMSGFATSYQKRKGATDPGLIMGYYSEAELPMYEFIANNFAICDAWYSAHPGPTWPNRFCATTGRAPEVENFALDDERLGYFRGDSIFDALTRFGVDWAYAEGNIGFLRMFDRYRLDIRNVIPFTDDFEQGIDDTWENRVRAGRLPSVSYIDPRFIDVPPRFDANDDLPPADVCLGQALVRRIYGLLSAAPTWSRTLFVVTYDEHGGFFDHQPPPGLPQAPNPEPQPRVHPDGSDHLGVRVPALVVSPWVDAGAVIHTPFDHTSLVKTILQRFAPDEQADGTAFGPRTEAANSLLDELRDSPRTDRPSPPQIDCRVNLRRRGPASLIEADDFQAGMRMLALPQARRARLLKTFSK